MIFHDHGGTSCSSAPRARTPNREEFARPSPYHPSGVFRAVPETREATPETCAVIGAGVGLGGEEISRMPVAECVVRHAPVPVLTVRALS